MLSDSSHEIRQQADSALSEFLQEIKNSPVSVLLPVVKPIQKSISIMEIFLCQELRHPASGQICLSSHVQFLMILLVL